MLEVTAYRYYCDNTKCNQKVFAEELEGFAGWYRRKTDRLEDLIITIAINTSCEACSRICKYMGIDISGDSVIRLIKNYAEKQEVSCSEIIGVDDWAYKKGQTYGTLICDGKTHKPVELLDGRDGSELRDWLLNYKHIKMVTRDRASAFAKVISEVLPDATQIADRFHLHQNLLKAVKDELGREIPNKVAIAEEGVENKTTFESEELEVKKNELTESEKRRKEDIILIQELLGQGYRTIRKYKVGDPDILCRSSITGKKRDSKLDSYADTIIQKISEGMILKDIFSFISIQGYKGKHTNFYSYCKRLIEENDLEYHTSKNTVGAPINRIKLHVRYVNRKEILDFLWLGKELTANHKEAIFNKYPVLYEIQACIRDFREIFNKKNAAYLYLFIEKYQYSQIRNVKSFVNGLLRDIDAIENAVSIPLSNGFLEGGNSRLKMIKRMMYGKAGLPLLKAKILC